MSKKARASGGIVYSTEHGRMCPGCGHPASVCVCRAEAEPAPPVGDGIVRLHRVTKGRKGAGVTRLTGIELDGARLEALAKRLKRRCGVGGAIREGAIELQGDQRERLKTLLEGEGFRVKVAGG